MWGFIFGMMSLCMLAGSFFLWSRFCRFGIVKMASGNRKRLRRLLGLVPMAVFGLFLWYDMVNTAVVIVHLTMCWIIVEFIAFIIRLIRRRSGNDCEEVQVNGFQPYIVGIIVICIEIAYFSAGWYLDHNVWEKDYDLVTSKDLGMEQLRIAQITDSHLGVTFDGDGFAEHMKSVQAARPDILVITGDYVDDDSTREDMIRSCEALKEFEAPYGKYFIYGNHDKGYYGNRNFTADDLEASLLDAGVKILKDETVSVDDRFCIVGRKDRSDTGREPIADLVSPIDPSKYIIVLDHQPADFAAEAASGADLVLCGHTHGGQMLFMKIAGMLMKANDRFYGIEERNGTVFIVSSGISDWAIKFKTGTRSEYCIIDVKSAP